MRGYTSIILEIHVFTKKIQPWQFYIYILLVEGVGVHERGDQGPKSSCFGGLDTWMKGVANL